LLLKPLKADTVAILTAANTTNNNNSCFMLGVKSKASYRLNWVFKIGLEVVDEISESRSDKMQIAYLINYL